MEFDGEKQEVGLMARYLKNDNDPDFYKIDEFRFIERSTGNRFFRCAGCKKLISEREFTANKGYCDKCRDGTNARVYGVTWV